MAPIIVLFACIFALCNAAPQFEEVQAKVVVMNETEYLRNHPEADIYPQRSIKRDGTTYHLTYSLGQEGDPLVITGELDDTLPNRQIKNILFKYPPNDMAHTQIATYIVAEVDQDSPNGKLYISKGGLGQPSLEVTLVCSEVTKYNVKFYVYGH